MAASDRRNLLPLPSSSSFRGQFPLLSQLSSGPRWLGQKSWAAFLAAAVHRVGPVVVVRPVTVFDWVGNPAAYDDDSFLYPSFFSPDLCRRKYVSGFAVTSSTEVVTSGVGTRGRGQMLREGGPNFAPGRG